MLNWNKERQTNTAVIGIQNKWDKSRVSADEAEFLVRYQNERPFISEWGHLETVVYNGENGFRYFVLAGVEGGEEKSGAAQFAFVKKIVHYCIREKLLAIDILADTLNIALGILLDGVLYRNVHQSMMKTTKDDVLQSVHIVADDMEAIVAAAEEWEAVYKGVNWTKELVNMPPNALTPKEMAYQALSLNSYDGMYCTVLNKEDLQQYKMNGILSVAQGSAEDPRLIVIEYTGNEASREKLGLVGKGVTYDSGGLSLKSAASMKTMKTDMAGAGAVLGAMKALAELQYPINAVAVLPCVENMPSGTSYKVDDVITMYGGKTVEVENTDAEGRIILCDAVSYIQEYGITRLIDLATLTGACETALGTVRAGAVTNHPVWNTVVCQAGETVRERVWPLPADDEYKDMIKGRQADLRNAPGSKGGAITAGLFIGAFVPDTLPWVHLDIAGTAYTDTADSAGYIGATGFGVKLLWKVMKDLV